MLRKVHMCQIPFFSPESWTLRARGAFAHRSTPRWSSCPHSLLVSGHSRRAGHSGHLVCASSIILSLGSSCSLPRARTSSLGFLMSSRCLGLKAELLWVESEYGSDDLRFWSHIFRVQIPTLPLASSMTSDTTPLFASLPHFPPLRRRAVRKIKWKHCLPQRKHCVS